MAELSEKQEPEVEENQKVHRSRSGFWFGIVIVLVVEMGMISPPVGITMFVVKGIAPDISMGTIFKGVLPFWLTTIIFAALLVAFPQIALFLPNLGG